MSSRGFNITVARRLERRKQAEARNEEYNKMSLQQKLDALPASGSKKQRARLEAAVNKSNQVPVQEPSNKKNKKEGK
jgi:hypothetical protein